VASRNFFLTFRFILSNAFRRFVRPQQHERCRPWGLFLLNPEDSMATAQTAVSAQNWSALKSLLKQSPAHGR
jgi:RecB family exonuclease